MHHAGNEILVFLCRICFVAQNESQVLQSGIFWSAIAHSPAGGGGVSAPPQDPPWWAFLYTVGPIEMAKTESPGGGAEKPPPPAGLELCNLI